MTLRDRIAALEQQRAPSEPELILIRGGLTEFDDTRATIGSDTLTRGADETFAAFKARALAHATATGAGCVCIGGLPS
jgi:hydroxymethylpyrimidine/phosphomethylpyrimidine kinase